MAPATLGRIYAILPTLLVAAATGVWALTPAIPVIVRGMGVMAPPDARRGFYARGPGEVQDLRVAVGDRVQAGQLLLTLSQVGQSAPGPGVGPEGSPQATTARLVAVAQRQAVLKVQSLALDDHQRALQTRREQIEATNRPVRSQLNALESLRKDDVIARYSPLWVGAQDLWLRNRAEISSVEALQAELRVRRAALQAEAAQLVAERAALLSAELAQDVFSPVAGQVLDLAVLAGQPVLAGQRLGSIALASLRPGREAVVLFTAADATRLRVGDEVKLNPQLLSRDSFGSAEQRYGLVAGRLLSLSRESVSAEEVAARVGSREEALNLMASARERSYGDGGDLTAQLPGRTGAPLVLAVVELEAATTPSGLRWSRGRGPAGPLPTRTPAEVEAEVERRSLVSYVAPFWRWLAGLRS